MARRVACLQNEPSSAVSSFKIYLNMLWASDSQLGLPHDENVGFLFVCCFGFVCFLFVFPLKPLPCMGGGGGGGADRGQTPSIGFNILPPTKIVGKRNLDAFKPHFPAPVIC